MSKVTFDYSKAAQFISDHEVAYMKKLTLDAKEVLVSKTGAGNDFLGWVDLPVDYDKERNAIAGSVVVPDLLIILIEKSLSPITSIKCLM